MEKADTIIIVDDNYVGRVILDQLFRDEYNIISAENGEEAIEVIEKNRSRLAAILLDLYMPVMDGFQVLRRLNSTGLTEEIPVFIISVENSGDKIMCAYDLGAADIIEKPFNPHFSRRRISNTIELYNHRRSMKNKLIEQNDTIIAQDGKINELASCVNDMLSSLIEFRSVEGGAHISRVRTMTRLVLSRLTERFEKYSFDKYSIELISDASVLHDIGKIAIPDSILSKPTKLSIDEFELVKGHTTKGCEILASMDFLKGSDIYRYSYDICRHHHERVDGRGYPDRLTGDEIPVWAKIVSIVDVYDSLVSSRCYKPAYYHEKALDMIMNGECGAFDNQVLIVFLELAEEIRMMYR